MAKLPESKMEGLAELLDELDTMHTGWNTQAAQRFDACPEWLDTFSVFEPSVTADENAGIDRDNRPELTATGTTFTSNLA